jgi:hypothetical protein
MSFSLFRCALVSRRDSARRPARRRILPTLERLEDRTVPTVVNPTVHLLLNPGALVPAGSAGQPGGLSPAEVRHAYGFDQITFQNGTVVGDGTGQTIAIVDAYSQPNIASDLAAFDSTYGIAAPPKFSVVNESGGSTLPTADSGWGLEISLDVEWAHAIAPGANILLVEASSNSWSNIFAAVNYARNQSGVAVVSMSFGGGEWSGQTSYDSYFTTPTGHSGVTFVASTGDSGSGTEFPSVSPNVVAVGGTNLSVDSLGNYVSETGWSGSGGGLSAYESQPSYQKGVVTQSSTMRAVPDVSYDAGTAVAIYDASGYGGWVQVQGTSVGAPQWAALVAVADQGLALSGKGSLDGATQTLPDLYKLSSNDFHDITSGGNGAYSAGPGYDLVTGLGTPVANLVVSDLVGTASPPPAPTNQPPVVVNPASASPTTVTGTTTNLSVLGGDPDGDALTYTWSVTSAPTGSTTTFSANGTNAAQNTTATFSMAGTYTFAATITDAGGLTATSSVTVVVNQTLTSVVVTPGSVSLADGGSQQFTATARDQFGNAMSTQPAWTWSVVGMGTVSGGGLYTAPIIGVGTDTVLALGDGLTGSAVVTVGSANQPPVVVAPASATPNPVAGTTTGLSVLGDDDGGAANLTYTWSVASAPAGSAAAFSVNGTNAAQNTTATFSMAGTYTFTATITDAGGLTATSSVTVVVNQTLTSVVVTPGSVSLADGGSQQFTASAKDQFGAAMSTQPAWTWSVVGMGTVSGSGLYTAPIIGVGTDTVQASGGGLTASASVSFDAAPAAPAAPSNLTAAVVSAKQINLSWTDNSGNETGFVIQRSTNGGNWSQLATVGANATSYSDRTVNKHHTYYYRVYAYNSFGNSAYSNTAGGVTPHVGTVGPHGALVGPALLTSASWPAPPAGSGMAAAGSAGSGQVGVQYISSGQNVIGSPAFAAANADALTAFHHLPPPSDAFWLLWSEDLTQDVFGPKVR